MRSTLLLAATLLLAPLALACSSKDEAKSDDKANDKPKAEDKPSLRLTNDTPACRSALSCCEEMVKLEKGGEAKPEDINLSCSGVGMAPDDATCGEFKKGYAMGIEASTKPVPDVCK
jgi:hypothetical protein